LPYLLIFPLAPAFQVPYPEDTVPPPYRFEVDEEKVGVRGEDQGLDPRPSVAAPDGYAPDAYEPDVALRGSGTDSGKPPWIGLTGVCRACTRLSTVSERSTCVRCVKFSGGLISERFFLLSFIS
ncbi:hypothetical protein PMAYCL1PPCAC_10166, partial [Pristionchus mayeri]